MSKKYIKQIDNENFVYANNTLAQYDVEIIHDLKENSVSGETSGFSVAISSNNLYLSFTYEWFLNNAEPFISDDGKLNILSVHLQTPTKQYYKPWICVGLIQRSNTALTYVTDTQNFIITPAMAGVSSFTAGNYYGEVRFIGKRGIYPIEQVATIVPFTPTPTPTVTITPTPGLSPSPTPTPSATPTNNNNLADIGTACNAGGCTEGTVIRIFLDNADYALFVANGYSFEGAGGGAPTTCTLIARNVLGNPITASCFLDSSSVSWILSSGVFTYHIPQC
jgi:hypothetical protein